MGMGINGHHCNECDSNFNTMWSSITMQFWDGKCPFCSSENVARLPLVVDVDGAPKGKPKFLSHYLDRLLETIQATGLNEKTAAEYKKWLPEYAEKIDAVILKDENVPKGLFADQ
jgi:hypothetical protein